jgi:hypothetical protein
MEMIDVSFDISNGQNTSCMPTPDDIDRDKIYTADTEDDDAELELEPPDAEVIAAEERRAKEAIEATMMSVDIDEVYREADRRDGGEFLDKWLRDFRFQFQVKHLLIATAVLAIAMTLWRLQIFGTTLVLLFMIAIGGAYFYVVWQEKKQQDEADRRRKEMYARQRAYFDRRNRGAASTDGGTVAEATVGHAVQPPPPPLPNEADVAWQEAMARQRFRFQFSLKQLLLAMMGAAVIFGLVRVFGGPANTATMLGLLALAGLVVHAAGFDPPEIIILGWWLILVMYVLMSIVAAVAGFA